MSVENRMDCPWLGGDLPKFTQLDCDKILPLVESFIAHNLKQIDRLLDQKGPYTWENLMVPMEENDDILDRLWSVVSHLNSVKNQPALRKAYNACLPKLSEYATQMGQNQRLYQAIESIAQGTHYASLSVAKKKALKDMLRDFRLSGVALGTHEKAQFAALQKELAQMTSQFSDNVLDATDAWFKDIEHEEQLAGLPQSAIALAKERAQAAEKTGWRLNLEFPCYHAVISFGEDRALREEIYRAYVTRASDQGPFAGKWDNSPLIEKIVQCRHQMARLLGYESYGEYSLETKMAKSPEHVLSFLKDLANRAYPMAQEEFKALKVFAHEQLQLDELNPWDISFASEKMRQAQFDLNPEELRPYFPEEKVIQGMFDVVEKLYHVQIQPIPDVDVWDPSVRFYQISDSKGIRGQFYLDLHARAHKRGGAWMDECQVRRKLKNGVQIPVAYLTCNFAGPSETLPGLLNHDEVLTLFHEFGHGLHHMLTKVDIKEVSGINGVPWDAVELPSQFLENWCYEAQALPLFSAHYQSQACLPESLLNKLKAAKNFQSGMRMVRQLEFALFDFKLHHQPNAQTLISAQAVLDEVRKEISVVPVPEYHRFAHSFGHVFSGGYAAGYYSYLWAEVLSCDAFSRFQEEGIFNSKTGQSFLENILERGGSMDPNDCFESFRGRAPSIEPLLKSHGLIT